MDAPAGRDSPYYTPEHDAFREQVRRFVAREIEPYAHDWDEAGEFPRALYAKAAEVGLLQLGFPEDYGGVECDRFFRIVAFEELGRAGVGGVSAGLMSNYIGAPPVAALGTPALKEAVLPGVMRGEKIAALAITEPSAGSDVANIRTTARREGGDYVVSGSKMFITSGMRADVYTVAVRTGGPGMGGLSLLVIEREREGFTRTPLKKMGWWCSDTAALYFDDVRVPAANLIGEENQGFRAIMLNFNDERLGMAAGCVGAAQTCIDEAAAYAKERETFGRKLVEHQVIRHKLADMQQAVNATKAYLEATAWRVDRGQSPVAEICLLKNHATQTMELCAREAMQILGGAGYLRGGKVERIYREVRVNAIGGGSEEIMKDLAARQMGL